MQIVEVKNNLVKINYNTSIENLVLSGFVVIKDEALSFIGQVVHLEANISENFAIVKLLFTFDENGVVTNYSGAIPGAKSLLDIVQPQELLELLTVQFPILIGELAQQKTLLTLDRSLLENKLLVCCEKNEDNSILIKNFVKQLVQGGKKVLVINTEGMAEDCNIVAGKNFKLPLNYETINFIYEKGLDDATAESKALIQEIFLEVQNYVKTLPQKFIPFESFKDVVDSQYQELGLVELVLLKNKLLKYYEAGVFAQEQTEFNSLKNSLEQKAETNLDLSGLDENLQREVIAYAYSVMTQIDKEIYVICTIGDENSDKKLLKQIFTAKNVYSTLICPYSYKYLKELKQLSKNLILFAPIQQQNDFAGYNTFLGKLNPQEFIIYGQATHHLPLIVKLEAVGAENLEEKALDEQIKRDVDEIYTAPKSEVVVDKQEEDDEDEFQVEVLGDDLTEDDLDFIDDLNIIQTDVKNEKIVDAKTPSLIEEEIKIGIQEELEETEEFSNVLTQQANEISPALENEPMFQPKLEPADILPVKTASTPIVPVYSAEIEPKAQSDELEQGDSVSHSKYGKGIVEKFITYGSKTLCSINFDNVGRRLLDPTLAEIKKI